MNSILSDIRNFKQLGQTVRSARPNVVILMAAQALVGAAYSDPLSTIGTNVMGTVNLLEHLHSVDALEAVLVITSDKVYANREAGLDFTEDATLGGHDPYSASKAATEVLTFAYSRNFFLDRDVSVMKARAGNVISGGDWALNWLWRAARHRLAVGPLSHRHRGQPVDDDSVVTSAASQRAPAI